MRSSYSRIQQSLRRSFPYARIQRDGTRGGICRGGVGDKKSELDETTVPYAPRNEELNGEKFEFAFVLPQSKKRMMLKSSTGLVASSDGEVRRKIAEILRQCGLSSVVASTVAECGIALAAQELSIVLCNECLVDGNYGDIVELVARSDAKAPVIVVSRTGDWPEFLAAIRSGAFDYLAYPPIPGELQRIIRNALLEHLGGV